ncbi:MAG TPA: RNA 2',3'-cyclic phosphodiesterase [Anaeromyxobacteraceae bacterium]|nr:RNA 2',3'-cyclic phosphodiesterase [Anaeromyxobacteraceae bacterium]
MPRLFIALDPPASVREALAALQADVPGARWTPSEKLHLTLHFHGYRPEEEAPALEVTLAGVSGTPFSLAVEGLGAFPNARAARVLVAHVGTEPGLMDLHGQIGGALEHLGLETERRPYRPHLTLARLKAPDREAVQAFLAQPAPPLSFRVEAFHLYESRLDPTGARYALLRSYPLS